MQTLSYAGVAKTPSRYDPDFQLESYTWLRENCGDEFCRWLGSSIEMHGPEQTTKMLAAAVEFLASPPDWLANSASPATRESASPE